MLTLFEHLQSKCCFMRAAARNADYTTFFDRLRAAIAARFLSPLNGYKCVLTVPKSTYTVTDETSSGRRETAVKGLPEERTIRLAQYMIEQKATVRQTAARFGISKSTVHKDITTRLQKLNTELYERVQTVLQVNKQERHIRGGRATQAKYRAEAAQRRGEK